MLELVDVHAGYGSSLILKGITLEVRRGELVALIGANGAGKTTTLRTIHGLAEVRSGVLCFKGEDLAGVPTADRVARGIGHVPEGRQIFSRLTVRENLLMGAYARNAERPGAIADDLDRVLAMFPRLAERLRQKGGTLSGGEQQMLAMGRALMGRPSLLLMDEPSMGLAPALVDQIFEIIAEIHRTGTAVLLVEQNAWLALKIADRGYVMATGAIAARGTGKGLRESEEVRMAYLGG